MSDMLWPFPSPRMHILIADRLICILSAVEHVVVFCQECMQIIEQLSVIIEEIRSRIAGLVFVPRFVT